VRVDYSPIAGININQTLMAVIVVISSIALILKHRKPVQKEEEVPAK